MPAQLYKTKTTSQMKNLINTSAVKCDLKNQIKTSLRVQDETNFITRYKWSNLPGDLTSEMIERMLYYKFDLIGFKINDDFYILPYTFNGDIDIYGRFMSAKPLPFFNGKDEVKNGDSWLSQYIKKIYYGGEVENAEDYAVILRDYTPTLQNQSLPRAIMQEPLLDYMSEILAMHRTSLINSSGVEGVRVNDSTEIEEIERLSRNVQDSALTGKKYVAVSSKIDMQNLDSHSAPNSQQFMTGYASIDNLRLSFIGVDNGGTQEKQGTIIQDEANAGKSNTRQILNNGLKNRQDFRDFINKLFNYNIGVEINENAKFEAVEIKPEEEEEAGDNATRDNTNLL